MAPDRPNIIVLMTDQQRYDTIGAWGCDHMVTPNLDRLTREGISFRQAYCPGATCISSRAAMFTGMYPHTTGVYSFDPWGDHRNWVQDLADSGYWCASIGKMHFSPRDIPGGFHERVVVENPTNKTHANGGSDDDWGKYLSFHGLTRPNDRQHTDPDWLKKFQAVPWHHEEQYHSDVFIGKSAVSWIRNHKGEGPLFLQVGFTGPHEPWDPLPRHLELYLDRAVPAPVVREGELAGKPPQHQEHLERFADARGEARIDLRLASDADLANMRRHYYAKITTVDEQLGLVLDALEDRGYLENSLLVFCSDHGEMLGDHGLPYKWLMYDPVVHVPMIVRHSGSVSHPSACDDLVSLMDIGPTILEAAGMEVPAYLEGRSLRALLEGEELAPRDFVCCEDNYQVMLRTPQHKLVYYIGQDDGELYDLEEDPHELWNRWADPGYAGPRQELCNRLLSWLSASNYANAGYRRTRARKYRLRWPRAGDASLHGATATSRPMEYL